MITLSMFEQAGINVNDPEVKTIANVLIRRHDKDGEKWTFESCLAYIENRIKQLATQKQEAQAAKASRDNDVIAPRQATKKDLNKSRGAVQTRYRRATLAKFDPSVKADKKSNVYEKRSIKSKASKEKRYNKSDDPMGWGTTSQGAGNVVGARSQKDDSSSERGLGGSYL